MGSWRSHESIMVFGVSNKTNYHEEETSSDKYVRAESSVEVEGYIKPSVNLVLSYLM